VGCRVRGGDGVGGGVPVVPSGSSSIHSWSAVYFFSWAVCGTKGLATVQVAPTVGLQRKKTARKMRTAREDSKSPGGGYWSCRPAGLEAVMSAVHAAQCWCTIGYGRPWWRELHEACEPCSCCHEERLFPMTICSGSKSVLCIRRPIGNCVNM